MKVFLFSIFTMALALTGTKTFASTPEEIAQCENDMGNEIGPPTAFPDYDGYQDLYFFNGGRVNRQMDLPSPGGDFHFGINGFNYLSHDK